MNISPKDFNNEKYIGLEHIGQGNFLLDSIGTAADVTSNKSIFQSGDILYGKIRPYFKKVYRPKFSGICSTDILIINSINEDVVIQDYLYQLIKTQEFTDKATETSSGTKMPRADWSSLIQLDYAFPPLPEQKAIASILSALDDKIELNLQMNKTLEEMAMALYKHWFVDFGPFQDGEFVDSELGEIPKGWEVKSIGDITKVVSKGTTPRQKDVDCLLESIPFLKVKDISNDGLIHDSKIELIPVEVHLKQLKRSILLEDDILFSIAGTIGRVSIVPKHLNNSNCNQALAFIRLSKEFSNNLTQVYYYFKSNEVQASINSSIVQGVQANVSLTVIKDLKIVIPTNELIKQFNLEVNNSFKLLRSNTIENQTLTQIRDTLLPKLISGEVRVKDVQQEIMEVL